MSKKEKRKSQSFIFTVLTIVILYFLIDGFSLYFFDKLPSQMIADFIARLIN